MVDARRRVGGGNGVERLLLGELVLSVGSPVKAEAHEAEHVVVGIVVAVLFVIYAQCSVGQNDCGAVAGAPGADGLRCTEGFAFVSGEADAHVLAAAAVGERFKGDVPGVAVERGTPNHVLAVAGSTADAAGEACFGGIFPSGAVVGGHVVIVVAVGAHEDGEVSVVAFERLGFVGVGCSACADHLPALTVVKAHEEVEVADVVSVAIDEAGNECAVAFLECGTGAGEAALPSRVGAAHAVETLRVVHGSAPGFATVGAHDGLPKLRLGCGGCPEAVTVGAGGSHDADDVAVVAVGDDGGIAVTIVSAEVFSGSDALRTSPGASHVVRILCHDVEHVRQVAVVLQTVVGQGDEAVHDGAVVEFLLHSGDGGDAIVARAAVIGHQGCTFGEEDGDGVLRVAVGFSHFGAVHDVAADGGVHGVSLGGVLCDVVGNPEVMFAHVQVG